MQSILICWNKYFYKTTLYFVWFSQNSKQHNIYIKVDLQQNSHYSYLVSKDSSCLTLLCCRCKICGNVITSSKKLKNEQLIAATRDRRSLDSLPKRLKWDVVEHDVFCLHSHATSFVEIFSQKYCLHLIKPWLVSLRVCFIIIVMLSFWALISQNLPYKFV